MGRNINSSPAISGKSIESVAREANSAISQLWAEINRLNTIIKSMSVGSPKIESGGSGVRLVQDSGSYHIEGKFKDGWARLATTTSLLTKKD